MLNLIGSFIIGLFTFGRKLAPAAFKGGTAVFIAAVLWLSDGLWDVVDTLWGKMPEEVTQPIEPFVPYLATANLLAPLKEMILLAAAFTAVWVAFVSIRFLIRSIPTMG